MKKRRHLISSLIIIYFLITILFFLMPACSKNKTELKEQLSSSGLLTLNFAVEYTSHAASFYYAREKNLFSEAGIALNDVKVYASGVGVAAAFTKGGFDVGYMCLVPAIFTYANGGVPIKIIAGTHKNGYAMVVNSAKIQSIGDLERADIKIANGRQGTSTDFLESILIERENLDREKVLANTLRMNGSKQLMALRGGKVDAIFVPEHFASLAASFSGMKMFIKSADIWPDMQGSLLVVSEDLLNEHPEIVEKLKLINEKSLRLMGENMDEAALIVSENLNINETLIKEQAKTEEADLSVNKDIAIQSLKNLELTSEISLEDVQEVIDKMYALGYLVKSFKAEEIVVMD